MKKIGIITTSNAINFGAVLQAYALKTTLDMLGQKCSVINYAGNESICGRNLYKDDKSIKNIIFNFFIFFKRKYKRNRKKLIKNFDEFNKNQIKMDSIKLYNFDDVILKLDYDILICGSDQIWNLNLNDDLIFFLPFYDIFPEKKYYSYAASIAENMSDNQLRIFRERISHFNEISVREEKSSIELEKKINRKVENVLDPVFLLEKECWNVLSSNHPIHSENYIFVFLIGHDKSDNSIIQSIKKKYNYNTVILNLHPIQYIKGDTIYNVVDPLQFLNLIKNASVIITDSFHTTAFSIIFNKQFFTIYRNSRNSRVENLFDKFKIQNRFMNKNNYMKILESELINYKIVNEYLKIEREKSYLFLNRIVKGEHEVD